MEDDIYHNYYTELKLNDTTSYLLFLCKKQPSLSKKSIHIPIDQMIMKYIEVTDIIPTLLLILILVTVIKSPSLYLMLTILGVFISSINTKIIRTRY